MRTSFIERSRLDSSSLRTETHDDMARGAYKNVPVVRIKPRNGNKYSPGCMRGGLEPSILNKGAGK